MNKGRHTLIELDRGRIGALDAAETRFFHSDFCPYLELKVLLRDGSPLSRKRFQGLFTSYYRLNAARLSVSCKDRFFDILFDDQECDWGRKKFAAILRELHRLSGSGKRSSLQVSFVSKLVNMRDEACPLYDVYVRQFFRWTPPLPSVELDRRITAHLDFLDDVKCSYEAWQHDDRVAAILDRFRQRDPGLGGCHVVRLLDFLVWKAGAEKLIATGSGTAS